jgi:hypothetical protein
MTGPGLTGHSVLSMTMTMPPITTRGASGRLGLRTTPNRAVADIGCAGIAAGKKMVTTARVSAAHSHYPRRC